MENHGKIMEFDSGKALGTLIKVSSFNGTASDNIALHSFSTQ